MDFFNIRFRSKFSLLSLALLLLIVWQLLQGYHGLIGDGQIYAFQAFARLHPQLAVDLYLSNTSQDRFTLFSVPYAWSIRSMGLENAPRVLTLLFTLWLWAAVYSLARAVTNRRLAWTAVAFLLIVGGHYGSSGVFRILEPFLTARLPAEAMIITALSCHIRGRKRLALLLAFTALFVHPLMALPGLLLLGCLWLPIRVAICGAIALILTTIAGSLVATEMPHAAYGLTVMDPQWLAVVRERSQFLLLQLWSIHDWDVNARPFVTLALTALVVNDARTRKICAAVALVGGAGLAVALVGSLIGPIAIFIQGQAWRWVWLAVLVSALLVPLTAMKLCQNDRCGVLCTLLLISGWTLPRIEGALWVGLALILWLADSRLRFMTQLVTYRWITMALGAGILAWISFKCWAGFSPHAASSVGVRWGAEQIREIFELKAPAVLLVTGVWLILGLSQSDWVPFVFCAVLATFAGFLFPTAFKQSRTLPSTADFASWEMLIPPTSTVLVAPPHDAGELVWFTLRRPSYLTLDQSAGVVFSRATALEVRRRSEVLRPIEDPDWKILSSLSSQSVHEHEPATDTRPITARKLAEVCRDPMLGFVISPESVGFDPVPHQQPGAWKGWKLYDCRHVRSARATLQ